MTGGSWHKYKKNCRDKARLLSRQNCTCRDKHVLVVTKLLSRQIFVILISLIIVHCLYIALFSALEQTHCAQWHVILNEWLYHFIARIIHIPGSGVLIALCGCCMAGATWNAAISAQVLCTPFNHTLGYSVTSFKATCTFGRMTRIFYVLLR